MTKAETKAVTKTARRRATGRRQPTTTARTAPPPPVTSWIAQKRDGGELDDGAIRTVIDGASRGTIPDYQLSALLMAIVWRGLSPRELATWLDAMVSSGDRMRLGRIAGTKVDKHSTGGVGDKVSLCLAPLVAACGVPVPMMSGRSLGHTGGTLDKLDAIPGFRSALAPRAFERVLARAGLVLAGQSATLAPADRRLYALRDATATVESIPLIASSILSKKIAEGADALVMDVKVGRGAFLPDRARARRLARTIVELGRRAGLRTVALLTAMDQPLGRAIGNACELAEAIEVLRGGGPADTRDLTVRLGAEMLVLGGQGPDLEAAAARIERAIASGAGLERLRRCVELQGGDPRVIDDPGRLPRARHQIVVRARRRGVVTRLDAGTLGRAATRLGAGRMRQEDRIDPGVGIVLHRKEGDPVDPREALCTVSFSDPRRLAGVRAQIADAFTIEPRAASGKARGRRLVLERIE